MAAHNLLVQDCHQAHRSMHSGLEIGYPVDPYTLQMRVAMTADSDRQTNGEDGVHCIEWVGGDNDHNIACCFLRHWPIVYRLRNGANGCDSIVIPAVFLIGFLQYPSRQHGCSAEVTG